jgi:Protein of unknown function (DUF3500)
MPERANEAVRRRVAAAMAAAADEWLQSLSGEQRVRARWPAPGADAETETERRRWFYTPTDHGGLPLRDMGATQQALAMQLVATGLSTPAFVTVAAVIGLEHVLEHRDGWRASRDRERLRDPEMYYLRVFGEPAGATAWGWRFGGHHVSLNYLVVDGVLRATTPCFLGANPASSPLLGSALLRPLSAVEDLARELVRSLSAPLAEQALLLHRSPWDILGRNQPLLESAEPAPPATGLWRDRAGSNPDAVLPAAEQAALALTATPKGVPGRELDPGQRELLSALLDTYLGRLPDGLAEAPELDAVHFAWAGGTARGEPHYYRLQAPRLLVEYDNTQDEANHAHSVWRDPTADFGHDVLRRHRAADHR